MRDSLRERREETFELLIVMGVGFNETVARIADQFDCAEGTVKSDINRMSEWLPKLDPDGAGSSYTRLREVRQARQRQRRYEMMAQRDDDYQAASRIADRLIKNIRLEVELSERFGLVDDEPADLELAQDLDPEDDALLDEWAGVGEPLELGSEDTG